MLGSPGCATAPNPSERGWVRLCSVRNRAARRSCCHRWIQVQRTQHARAARRRLFGSELKKQPHCITSRRMWLAPSSGTRTFASATGQAAPSSSALATPRQALRWRNHPDVVAGIADLEPGFVARPLGRNAGIDHQDGAFAANAQDPFDPGAVHPAGRARVPGPAAPAHVGRDRIHVGGDDVGLDLVALGRRRCQGMVDGVQQREQSGGLGPVAQPGKREDGPHRRVAVLAAVLAQARRVALDVAGIALRSGRKAAQTAGPGRRRGGSARSSMDAIAVAARSGSAAPDSTAHDWAIESIAHSPLSLRAEPGAVVVGGAAIPLAVPGLALQRLAQRQRVRAPNGRATPSPGFRPAARTRRSSPAAASRARRFLPARLRRRGSCRRSSRRCPSAAARAAR